MLPGTVLWAEEALLELPLHLELCTFSSGEEEGIVAQEEYSLPLTSPPHN